MNELTANLREAITGCLSVAVDEPLADPDGQVLEIAV